MFEVLLQAFFKCVVYLITVINTTTNAYVYSLQQTRGIFEEMRKALQNGPLLVC